MKTGKIVTAFPQRGFGFIQTDATGKEIFAHVSDFPNHILLPVGSHVEFEAGNFRGRPKAVKIRPIATLDLMGAR